MIASRKRESTAPVSRIVSPWPNWRSEACRNSAWPPSCAIPTSNDTRVRVEGLANTIPSERSGRRRCSSPAFSLRFSSAASSSSASSSSRLQSAILRKCLPLRLSIARSYPLQQLDNIALRFYPYDGIKMKGGYEMATLMRFDPFREVAALQTEMGRLMSGLLEGSGGGHGGPGRKVGPALEGWGTDDAPVYAFDLPGIPEGKISIELEGNGLTVPAERE